MRSLTGEPYKLYQGIRSLLVAPPNSEGAATEHPFSLHLLRELDVREPSRNTQWQRPLDLRIELTVKRRDGAVLRNSTVTFEDLTLSVPSLPQRLRTDAEGRFQVFLSPGRHLVRFGCPGFQSRVFEVETTPAENREGVLVFGD